MVLRNPRKGILSSSPNFCMGIGLNRSVDETACAVAQPFTRFTSSSVILPPGPVPLRREVSTFKSWARFLT